MNWIMIVCSLVTKHSSLLSFLFLEVCTAKCPMSPSNNCSFKGVLAKKSPTTPWTYQQSYILAFWICACKKHGDLRLVLPGIPCQCSLPVWYLILAPSLYAIPTKAQVSKSRNRNNRSQQNMIYWTECLKVFPTAFSTMQNFSKFRQNKISPIE